MPHVMETLQGSSTIGRLYVFFSFVSLIGYCMRVFMLLAAI